MKNKLKKYVNSNIKYNLLTPEFVEIGNPTYQELHADSKNVKIEKPYHQLIFHMPLDAKEIFLPLGKVKINKEDKSMPMLKQGIIFIPFGKAVSLPSTQLHGGHYAKPGNSCFHSVFAEHVWNFRNFQDF